MISYREWKEQSVINELDGVEQPQDGVEQPQPQPQPQPQQTNFNVARNIGQGRSALKAMDPKITAFGANLASALGQIEATMPGYSRKIITKIVQTLTQSSDIPPNVARLLRTKLMQAVPALNAGQENG
jgi:hypothetical protein